MALRIATLACLCAFCLCTRAAADDAAPAPGASDRFDAHATVTRPIVATNREDPSASGTEVDARKRVAAYETVSDVLLEAPGARPFRTGALGSFTSASLRGAEIDHTVVLFGDIPISAADASAFNLSTIPLSLLDRVTVYRGGAPAWISQGAIGGVIQLVPRSAQGTTLTGTVTGGSFSTLGLGTEASVGASSAGAPALLAAAGGLGSSGDFKYEFDNNTALYTGDDYVTRRRNADFIEAHALVHLQQPLGPGALELLLLGLSRTGGEPGSPANPLNTARHDFTRGLLGVGYKLEQIDAAGERELRLQALVAGNFERTLVADPYPGAIPSRRTRWDSLGTRELGRLAGDVALTRFLELTLIATGQYESQAGEDPFALVQLPASARSSVAGIAEANLHGKIANHRVELRPSLRVERSSAALHSERFGAAVEHEVDLSLPTYRVGLALQLISDLSLSASAASGRRTPSMLELFGDGALIEGNAALAPERSQSVDVGLVESTRAGFFAGTFELRAFRLRIADQILFVRNSFAQLLPLNLAHSSIDGVEAGARASVGIFWLNAAATLLSTRGKPGKRLPNRPPAIAFVQPGLTLRPQGALDAVQLFVESSFAGQSYDDPDNETQPKSSVLLFGAGGALTFLQERAEVRVMVNDLFDRGGQDVRGFPFPGRTVLASLTYKEGS